MVEDMHRVTHQVIEYNEDQELDTVDHHSQPATRSRAVLVPKRCREPLECAGIMLSEGTLSIYARVKLLMLAVLERF